MGRVQRWAERGQCAQNVTQWVTSSNWQHLAGMLWKDMRLLAMRLDNAQRLAMCWVRPYPETVITHSWLVQPAIVSAAGMLVTGVLLAHKCSQRVSADLRSAEVPRPC